MTAGRFQADFEAFWAIWPRKVARFYAMKAYVKARTVEKASAEDILAGVERYKIAKPAYADWCFAATFLNQGRWLDEPDTPTVKAAAPVESTREWARRLGYCQHKPRCEDAGGDACYAMWTGVKETV